MKKRKISTRLKSQIDDLHENRVSLDRYLENYMLNFSEYAKPMHALLPVKHDVNRIKIAAFQYLSSIISCWETYWRDTFTFIASIDAKFRISAIETIRLNENEVAEIRMHVNACEYLAKCINFQNLAEIRQAFKPVFNEDIFEYSSKIKTTVYFPKSGKIGLFSISELFSDYEEMLSSSLEVRHKIIHDANFIRSAPFEMATIQKAETLFLLFPQIISHSLSDRYKLPRYKIASNGTEFDALFFVEDLISNDWLIKDDLD